MYVMIFDHIDVHSLCLSSNYLHFLPSIFSPNILSVLCFFFNNPLSPISVVHMCMSVGLSFGGLVSYQWPNPPGLGLCQKLASS